MHQNIGGSAESALQTEPPPDGAEGLVLGLTRLPGGGQAMMTLFSSYFQMPFLSKSNILQNNCYLLLTTSALTEATSVLWLVAEGRLGAEAAIFYGWMGYSH